jgi:M3 family oligoendopeptidase
MRARARFAPATTRPDLEQVLDRTRALAEQVEHSSSASVALQAIREWNRLRAEVHGQEARAVVAYHQNTENAAARAEQDFWNEAAPTLRELEVLHARALTSSRQAEPIAREFGPQLLRLKRCAATTFAPEIRQPLAEEARLVTRYGELMATRAIEMDGQFQSPAGVRRFLSLADRGKRLRAHQAKDRFLAERRNELDDLFDQLVRLRDQMGKTLGSGGYAPLAYQLRSRIGYGPEDVARLREAIRAEVVPLCEQIHARQAARLGVEKILYHDELVWYPEGNPVPLGGPDALLLAAREMYRDLHPEFGAFFDVMLENELFDVELRDGKTQTGFCHTFPDVGLPFVFAQLVGTDYDVHVLTHECGHAFQNYSARNQPLIEYMVPTSEAAEVASLSMELLAYPGLERLLGNAAGRYRRGHLEQAITKLPLLALGDHFQQKVYEHPALTPGDRHALWRELEQKYLPWRDYGDHLPHLSAGGGWQGLSHLYLWPFVFIDYALASTAALQLHQRSLEDQDAALEDYLAICRAGGSRSFTELLELGRLKSPFESDTLQLVSAHARRALQL